jgi:hypothetical protein
LALFVAPRTLLPWSVIRNPTTGLVSFVAFLLFCYVPDVSHGTTHKYIIDIYKVDRHVANESARIGQQQHGRRVEVAPRLFDANGNASDLSVPRMDAPAHAPVCRS